MINLSKLRLAARIFFVAMLFMAFMLIFSVREAKAADTKPTLQTDNSGRIPNDPRVGDIDQVDDNSAKDQPNLIEMTQQVANKVAQNGGPYILGRDEEVQNIGEKMMVSDSHTVVIQAENGGGGMGLIEEYVRQNPDDKVFRLNMEKMKTLDPTAAAKAVKAAINEIEKMNTEAKGQRRYVLVVENLSGLMRDQFAQAQPIQSLREAIVRRANVYTLILTDPQTAKTQLMEERFSVIRNLVEILSVKPPAYDQVVAYLLRYKSTLEKNGVSISTAAIENAARISVRFKGNQAFKWGYQFLASSVRRAEADMRAGSRSVDRNKTEVNQLKKLAASLKEDFKAETDKGEKDALQKRFTDTINQIRAKNKEIRTFELSKDLTQPKRAADLELDLANLEVEREHAMKPKESSGQKGGWFGGIFGSSDTADATTTSATRSLGEIETDISKKTLEHTNLVKAELAAANENGPNLRIGVSEVVATAARMLDEDPLRLTANFEEGLRRLDELKLEIFDQDPVIDIIRDALTVKAYKLTDGPIFEANQWNAVMRDEVVSTDAPESFISVGPTGSGKTETALQLSKKLGVLPLQYDMSEFMEKHNVSRFIGSPPGYVGSTEMGQLLRDVQQNPDAVILLDEIEKAHQDVFDILLQILDKGRLTDAGTGKTVDFRRTTIIMTSNLMQEIGSLDEKGLVLELKSMGVSELEIRKQTGMRLNALRTLAWSTKVVHQGKMRPEFVGRIKHFLPYNAITEETSIKIAKKLFKQFVSRMKMNGVDVRFTPGAILETVQMTNTAQGGRGTKKSIMALFRMPVAKLLAENKVVRGQTLVIDYNEQRELSWKAISPAELAAAEAQVKPAQTTETGNTNLSEVAEQQKTAARGRSKAAQELRLARAATSRLMSRIFEKEWFVSEDTFRILKRGR